MSVCLQLSVTLVAPTNRDTLEVEQLKRLPASLPPRPSRIGHLSPIGRRGACTSPLRQTFDPRLHASHSSPQRVAEQQQQPLPGETRPCAMSSMTTTPARALRKRAASDVAPKRCIPHTTRTKWSHTPPPACTHVRMLRRRGVRRLRPRNPQRTLSHCKRETHPLPSRSHSTLYHPLRILIPTLPPRHNTASGVPSV